jgi:nitrogenase molybdenum-iron protein alpha/beta subunit
MVLIDDDVTAEEGLVNIIGEKSLASNWELNFRKVREMLQRIGLRVNCRFIGNTTVRSINDFKKAELNLMAYADAGNELIKARLAQRFKGTYYDQAFPVGLNETTSWLRGLARITGKEDAAEKLIEDRIKALAPTTNDQPLLSGKNVLVLADGMYVDWLLDVLFDLQAEVPKVILGHRSEAVRRSRYGSRVRFVSVGNEMELEREMAELEPDLVLSTWSMKSMIACRNDIIPVFPEVGFDADLKIAKRLARILRLPAREGWREGIRT